MLLENRGVVIEGARAEIVALVDPLGGEASEGHGAGFGVDPPSSAYVRLHPRDVGVGVSRRFEGVWGLVALSFVPVARLMPP